LPRINFSGGRSRSSGIGPAGGGRPSSTFATSTVRSFATGVSGDGPYPVSSGARGGVSLGSSTAVGAVTGSGAGPGAGIGCGGGAPGPPHATASTGSTTQRRIRYFFSSGFGSSIGLGPLSPVTFTR
jgi:hypothetical protein